MHLDGAIFDLDGTLFDSMWMWRSLAAEYIATLDVTPEPELDKKLTSMTLGQAVEYCIEKYGLSGTVPEHVRNISKLITTFYLEKVELKEGVIELLDMLKEMDVRMCIATATDLHLVEPALKRNGIYEYFSHVFTCSGVGKTKTSPHIYDISLAHLGTDKQKTVVFEDAYYAASTAKAAGYKLIGVYDKSEHNTQGVKDISDIYVKSLSELTPKLFEEI